MEAQPGDQTVMEETTGASAAATGHGDCDHGREQEVGDGGNERAVEGEQRATEMNGAQSRAIGLKYSGRGWQW